MSRMRNENQGEFMLTVAVCTHNPRPDLIARAIAGLKAQTLSTHCWELLIIDNNSDIPLQESVDVSWHPFARVLRETTLGLTPARLRAIAEVRGASIVFVDDDNILDPEYLQRALNILEMYPDIGVFGGSTIGEFETAVPEWASWVIGGLGVRTVGIKGKPMWALTPNPGNFTPIGAGMVVRREVAEYYADLTANDDVSFGLDRKGSSLMSGGDTEIALCAFELDLAQGVFPELRLTHVITSGRLELDYLKRLRYGLKYSATILKLKRLASSPTTSKYPRSVLLLKKWVNAGCPRGYAGQLIRAGYKGEIDAMADYAHYLAARQTKAGLHKRKNQLC